ncbi:MAG: REP-associated tyrosine transposase [Ramlibacter sp.]
MPRYLRNFIPSGTYFFTVALEDRRSDLLVREIARLREAYAVVQRRHPFETLTICILPDHLHAVWRLPPDDPRVSMRWSLIKHGFSSGLPAPATNRSQASRREKGIWQRRFWEHQIRNDDDLVRHVEYIHFNPVKHGLVRQVRDWPFSSFHRWVRRGDLPEAWGMVETAGSGSFGERHGAQAEPAHPTGQTSPGS